MAVVIAEIVTEVVVGPPPAEKAGRERAEPEQEELVEMVVRRATERVLEILRREWDD